MDHYLSDHCPISLTMDGYYISTHQEKTMGQDKAHDTREIPRVTLLRVEWTDEETTLFMYELEKRERKRQGENIAARLQRNPSRNDINLAVESINKVILTSMETTCQTWTIKKPNPEWTASKPISHGLIGAVRTLKFKCATGRGYTRAST